MAVLRYWMERGTAVISDWWGTGTHGYKHKTVNHTMEFIDLRTGAHTNTIDSTWRYVKPYLNPYNRMVYNIYQMAHYILPARCRTKNADQFTKFIVVVTSMDWSATTSLDPSNVCK